MSDLSCLVFLNITYLHAIKHLSGISCQASFKRNAPLHLIRHRTKANSSFSVDQKLNREIMLPSKVVLVAVLMLFASFLIGVMSYKRGSPERFPQEEGEALEYGRSLFKNAPCGMTIRCQNTNRRRRRSGVSEHELRIEPSWPRLLVLKQIQQLCIIWLLNRSDMHVKCKPLLED